MGAIETPPLFQRHLLTVDDYYRMAEAGVLAPDARVELIEGEIIDMAPMKSRHARVVNELSTRLHEVVGRRAVITCQTPLRLSPRSEPEPDLMLLRPRPDGYGASHPGAADVLLLIEVADSGARYDREIKVPLYARHGVAEVWIVDLEAGCVVVHRGCSDGAYADVVSSVNPGAAALPGIEGLVLDLGGIFE
jgi:Uma2 family endonuclease